MLSFDNTEIAFKSKNDKDLKRAYYLFKMVSSPGLVKFGKKATHFSLAIGLPIKGLIKATIFKQFCGGETIDECDKTIALLDKYGIGTILDYSAEGKESETDFDKTTNEIIATITKANGNKAIPFSVFKVTGISSFSLLERASGKEKLRSADKEKLNSVKERVNSICKAAFEADTPVFIDAEESWIQPAIDQIATEMMEQYNISKAIVYNTIQLYRHDRLAHIKSSIEESKTKGYCYGVKLVRGAYMEKERERAKEKGYPSPIQPDKNASDRDYDLALDTCLENISHVSICAGTHNEKSSMYLTELMKKYKLEKHDKRIYFAQLLGMSDHISYNLSEAGYNVAKYVPYGPIKEVLPYLIRRAEENTSVAGQTSRELGLILKERLRRKKTR
ncbi:MAG: proline dehydrogenase family protein [Flavobacteriales bacterium]